MPGQETNILLLETVLSKAKIEVDKTGVKLNAILVPGDLVKHGLASMNTSDTNINWPEML